MPQLSKCFSHLDTKAVNDHVFLVLVRRKEFCGLNADCFTHGDDMEGRVVGAFVKCAEEVGDAHKWCFALTWIRKTS